MERYRAQEGVEQRWMLKGGDTFNKVGQRHLIAFGPEIAAGECVEVVPESQLAEAVEALEKIEQRADPKRKLDGQAAAVALDSIYRWARKGLNRPGGR